MHESLEAWKFGGGELRILIDGLGKKPEGGGNGDEIFLARDWHSKRYSGGPSQHYGGKQKNYRYRPSKRGVMGGGCIYIGGYPIYRQ